MDALEHALEAARDEGPSFHDPEDGPLPMNSYAAGHDAGMREMLEAFPRMWAAANRSIAADPPAEMVEAGRIAVAPILSTPSAARVISTALTALANRLEARNA